MYIYINIICRIKTLPFERRFNAKQVCNVIKKGSSDINLKTWTYLEVQHDGSLMTGHNQLMDGETVVSRKGALYLSQSDVIDDLSVSVLVPNYIIHMHILCSYIYSCTFKCKIVFFDNCTHGMYMQSQESPPKSPVVMSREEDSREEVSVMSQEGEREEESPATIVRKAKEAVAKLKVCRQQCFPVSLW